MNKADEAFVFRHSPLLTYHSFEEEKRRTSALPYLKKLQLSDDEVETPPDFHQSAEASITELAQKHNYTVTYYLKLLGRAELEADAIREREKEEERLREEERSRALQSREKAAAPAQVKAKTPAPAEKAAEKRAARDQLESLADRNRVAKRTLAAMLEARIEQYRQDPDLRQKLVYDVARMRSRRSENANARDVVELNKTAFKALTRETMVQQMHERMCAMNVHFEKVVQHRQQLEEDDYQRKLKIMNRKELIEAERRRQIALEQQRIRTQEKQKKWLVLLALVGRQGLFMYRVKQGRIEREVNKVKIEAAIKIQRCYRLHLRVVQGRVWRRRMIIVHRTLRRCILHFRIERKRKAANLVQTFLLDLQDVNHIVQVVKRFRFQVKRSQTYWRRYREIQAAEMTLLRMQWDSIETQQLLERKTKLDNDAKKQNVMENALNYVSTSKKNKKGGINTSPPSRAARRFSIGKPHTPVPAKATDLQLVAEPIKTRLLTEHLKTRRKAYALEAEAYREELRRWEEVERQHAKVRASFEAARRQLQDSSPAVAVFELTFGPSPGSGSSNAPGSRKGGRNKPGTSSGTKGGGRPQPSQPVIIQPQLPPNPKPRHPGVFKLLLETEEMLELIEAGQREQGGGASAAAVSREPSQVQAQLQGQRSSLLPVSDAEKPQRRPSMSGAPGSRGRAASPEQSAGRQGSVRFPAVK